ncbi:MAG: MFS transporter [Paracoccaceae bacterium]
MQHKVLVAILVMASFFASVAIGSTSIVAPWLLLKNFQPLFYSVLACIVAVCSIFFLPALGRSLTRLRARSILGAASIGMSVMCFVTYSYSAYEDWLKVLITIVFISMETFFLVFVAARITLVKKIVPENLYSKVSTILEMEFQIAAFGAGALAAFLLGQFSTSIVLLINAGLFLISAVLFMLINEAKTNHTPYAADEDDKVDLAAKIPEPGLSIIALILAMNVPFVCIMLMNVILPIHIEGKLDGTPQDLAFANLIYTGGAISSFLLIWFVLARDHGLHVKIIVLFLIFSLAAVMVQLSIRIEVLFFCCFVWGAINSTAKVAGQTLILKHTDEMTVSVVTAKSQAHVQMLRVISMVFLSIIILFTGDGYLFGYMALFTLLGPALILISQALRTRSVSQEQSL